MLNFMILYDMLAPNLCVYNALGYIHNIHALDKLSLNQ